jgi:site-specific DNA-methyltransferase (adenine-specific)
MLACSCDQSERSLALAHQGDLFTLFSRRLKPFFRTRKGVLFSADCLDVLPEIKDECVDTVFADPPFNLGKSYGSKTNDRRTDQSYIAWSKIWLSECIRVLRPGGSLFLYNLPKWNIVLAGYLLQEGLSFRHWIAVEMNARAPIHGRLYPSHYSLLYFSKGKPARFHRIRTPFETCRHCRKEIKDYGGYRSRMHAKGVSLKDVWTDIPPVRHRKFKSPNRVSNTLSTKLLTRVIQLSTDPGDLVLDPFGGSGTTFSVCEELARYWIGIEIEDVNQIVDRLVNDEVRPHPTQDFAE